MSFKFLDGNQPITFVYPFQDLLVSMTEALQNQDFTAYVDLVSHLRNMSILAFDEKNLEALEKIDDSISLCKKHIDVAMRKSLESSKLYNAIDQNAAIWKVKDLKTFVDYRFSGVIERVCIYALRRTIFRDQVPEAQHTVFYDPGRDIARTFQAINGVFEECGLIPCEVIL